MRKETIFLDLNSYNYQNRSKECDKAPARNYGAAEHSCRDQRVDHQTGQRPDFWQATVSKPMLPIRPLQFLQIHKPEAIGRIRQVLCKTHTLINVA
jgi:hypothetical protein